MVLIVGLTILNMRRVKESVFVLTLVFVIFLITHFTASDLLLYYLLWRTVLVDGTTLNAVPLEQVAGHFSLGRHL